MANEETIPKWKALAVLSSDALSSVAYATEEILIPLAAFSLAAISWSMPIAVAIALLLFIICASYRQTIAAYPSGGGAYSVAHDQLGVTPGLVAAASLLIDYTLTVSVSVSSGVENIASALPFLAAHRELIGAIVILFIMTMNLRGIRDSASVFAVPTYLFVGSMILMIGTGAAKLMLGIATPAAPIIHEAYPYIPAILLMRAFSSGCSALTGVEAISNGTPIFRPPAARNARTTLVWMCVLLGGLFLGLTLVAHVYGIVPSEGQTTISLLARTVFGEGAMYYLIQASTALVLFLAANTSYADFPRLASLLAKDRFLPRQMASLGDRLVFSNGIIWLSGAAIILIFMFHGETHHLIPLYSVGVFLSFTLSQAGMCMRHWRRKEEHWRKSMIFNFTGMVTTGVVLIVTASTKFMHGAWMVIVLIPILVFFFTRIHRHYLAVGRELSLIGVKAPATLEPLRHTVVIPVSGIHRGVIDALRYALSISDDVRACYVELDPEITTRMKEEWNKWAHEVPFIVLKSPFRSVITPLLDYIDDIEESCHRDIITVIIPEFVTAKWWHQVLHNQTAFLIRAALLIRQKKVVTSVRYHLRGT